MTPEESRSFAREAGLCFVSDDMPGYRRKPWGRGFIYLDEEKNEKLANKKELARIDALKVPPAWKDVWISRQPDGHLQATGYDNRGRKQYLYHADWLESRNNQKFFRIYEFGLVLPRLRRVTKRHLQEPGLTRDKVLAAIVNIMDVTLIRIGNNSYARENQSYGLTTLRKKHVEINGREALLAFEGKGGKAHSITLDDRQLVRIIGKCSALPGYELFKYMDENGRKQYVQSGDVNGYIQRITGGYFTAKNFRTWGGSVRALEEYEVELQVTGRDPRKNILTQVVKRVAKNLNNTVAICRDYYIHPSIIKLIEKRAPVNISATPKNIRGLGRSENLLMELIEGFEQ